MYFCRFLVFLYGADEMKHANRYRIDHIIKNLIDGDFIKAKEQTQYRCRTIPEKQAYIVGQVVGSLCDPDGFHKKPDLAVKYLNMFAVEYQLFEL